MNDKVIILLSIAISLLLWSPKATLAQTFEASNASNNSPLYERTQTKSRQETFRKLYKQRASGYDQELSKFWKSFKEAVLSDDPKAIAEHCCFPVVNASDGVGLPGPFLDYDQERFLLNYEEIFTPYAVYKILKSSSSDLQISDDGTKAYLMFQFGRTITREEVVFEPVTDGDYVIWACLCFEKYGSGYKMNEIQLAL